MFNSRALSAMSNAIAQRVEQAAAVSVIRHETSIVNAIKEQAAKQHEFHNSIQLRISETEREKAAYLSIAGNSEHWEKAEQILSQALAKHQQKSAKD